MATLFFWPNSPPYFNWQPIYCKTYEKGRNFWDVCFFSDCLNDDIIVSLLLLGKEGMRKVVNKNCKKPPPYIKKDPIIPSRWDVDDDYVYRRYKQWNWKDRDNITNLLETKVELLLMFHPLVSLTSLENFEKDNSNHVWKSKIQLLEKLMDEPKEFLQQNQFQTGNLKTQSDKIYFFRKIDENQKKIERTLKQQTTTLLTTTETFRKRIETIHNEILLLLVQRLPFDIKEKEIK